MRPALQSEDAFVSREKNDILAEVRENATHSSYRMLYILSTLDVSATIKFSLSADVVLNQLTCNKP